MSNPKNIDEIKAFIRSNPDVGRRNLSKIFGIPERQAEKIKKATVPEQYKHINTDTKDIDNKIISITSKSAKSIIDIANALNISPQMVQDAVNRLKLNKKIIYQENDFIVTDSTIKKKDPVTINISKHGENELIFGGIADTHIGSKYERLDVLNSLYDRFVDAGVTTVFHGGNWIDGESRFNKTDIYAFGLGNQVENFIEKYPQRKEIKNYIISGDDHEGWYVQRENINIGEYMQMIAQKNGRYDLIDAGYIERDFELKQKNGSSILRLIHAGGGSTYAISYTAQKYVEMLQGGEKPQIVLVGHYHKFEYGYPREVHVCQLGCTEDQTPFMRKKKMQAMVGGCIFRIKQADNGIITSFNVEWMPYYDKKFYEYKW